MPSVRTLAIGVALFAATPPVPATAAPDPLGAVSDALRAPVVLAGNTVGAAGLITAASVALAGDAVSLVDANRLTRPVLRGLGSRAIHRIALAISWSGTGALEALRGEDIERLPEHPATYLEAAPTVGRLTTGLDGFAAARLAVGDLLHAPLSVGLRLVGDGARADRVAGRRAEARERALGPLPAPPYTGPPPPTQPEPDRLPPHKEDPR